MTYQLRISVGLSRRDGSDDLTGKECGLHPRYAWDLDNKIYKRNWWWQRRELYYSKYSSHEGVKYEKQLRVQARQPRKRKQEKDAQTAATCCFETGCRWRRREDHLLGLLITAVCCLVLPARRDSLLLPESLLCKTNWLSVNCHIEPVRVRSTGHARQN